MSIKKNFAYSSILTISGYLFPLITYPYVSRVLGVENIGTCNFVESIISYFLLFSMMGINSCGIREVAIAKRNREKLSKVFSEIISLNALFTITTLILLVLCINFVPQFLPYRDMMYIGATRIICSMFLIEWFFSGLEDFSYITKRSLIVKTLFAISIFLFIHKSGDYKIYYVLLVMMSCANAIFNIIHSTKYIHFSFSDLHIKKYLSTCFTLGLYSLITSMYSSFNVAWLGLSVNTKEVGYYTTATKLQILILAVFTALTNVMLPRLSSLLANGNFVEFKNKINKSVDALFAFAFPIVSLSVIFCPIIIHLLSGSGYEGSYLPFRILLPLIFIIGYEQILVLQILMPLKKDKAILTNSIIGAIVGIILNITFVPKMGAIGSSIVWLCSEVCVLIAAQYCVHKFLNYNFPFIKIIKYATCYTPLCVILWGCINFFYFSDIIKLALAITITIVYTLLLQTYIIRNELALQLIQKFIYIFKKNI